MPPPAHRRRPQPSGTAVTIVAHEHERLDRGIELVAGRRKVSIPRQPP
jgi:hypothetical protein